MNYGLYLSASGLLTNTYRQDVYANNLANVNTVAFKPDVAAVQGRSAEAVEDDLRSDVSGQLLDRLGGGVQAAPQRIAFAPGAQEKTGDPMDVSIEHPRGFFQVRTAGADGETVDMLTRAGSFLVSDGGELVTHHGDVVLDEKGKPIDVPDGLAVSFLPHGDVLAGDVPTGQRIGVFEPADLTALEKAGGNRFALKRATDLEPIAGPVLRPETREASAADPITTLMQLIAATKAATGNANMIRYHDTLMDRAVNTLGRVA